MTRSRRWGLTKEEAVAAEASAQALADEAMELRHSWRQPGRVAQILSYLYHVWDPVVCVPGEAEAGVRLALALKK